ncbi:MAG: hypothetical protein FWH04_10060 [Oscillospiraceae bacterium]|nr:hypothetical protein [Oscillospiraceae bacterium]
MKGINHDTGHGHSGKQSLSMIFQIPPPHQAEAVGVIFGFIRQGEVGEIVVLRR